jgi:hypothetical protein
MAEKWSIRGTYFETCNCDAACPCVMLSDPTEDDCTVMVGWHIEEGSFEDVSLDGLNVALAAYCPGNMAKVPWQAAVYLDDRASQAQAKALGQIFSGQAGGHPARLTQHIGEMLGARSVPIKFRANGRRRSLSVGDVAQAAIQAVEGQGGSEITVANHPLAIAPGYPAVVSHSESVRYQDYNFQWELSDKNGFYSPFSYQAS